MALRTEKLNRFRNLAKAAAAAVVLAASATSAMAADVTLRAIFLPATWGTVVRDVLAPEYAKANNINIEVQLVGRDAIHEKMATLFAAQDSSFDIFNLDYSWIPEFGGGGHLLPLDDVLTADDRSDFLKLALSVGTWDSVLYGIPQTIHPAVLWYRKDLYDDAAIQKQYKDAVGKDLLPPATMADWLDQMKFFNGKEFNGQKVYGWAAQAAKGFGNVHTWLSFLYTFGGKAFNDDFSKSTLSTPEAIAATKFWAEMMQYMPPGSNDFTYDNVTTAAQQGTIATALQWSWGAFAVDDPANSKTVGKWAFVQVPPVTAGGPSHPHLASWVISVSKYSQHADEAKKFIAWLETKENDVRQASLGGGDPTRQSSYSNPTLTDEVLAGTDVKRFRRYPVVLQAMQATEPRPFYAGEERWETAVTGPLQAISLGQMSAEEGLAEADKAVDRLLQR
jgi:ABC-type glycerol-3-phosphate transport system substrate-binding protein